MKRLLMGTAAGLLAAVLLFPVTARGVSARRGIVLDSIGERILWEREPEARSLIASTTKIMTALVVCENCNVLEPVRIPAEAVGIEGSSIYLKPGEVLTVQDLLYGMMLSSGNDAAAALAIHCGGSLENFAAMMNRKAGSLGMTRSHFENPHGLDGKNHCSTARDLGILGLAAMKNPIFARTVSTKTVRAGDRYLRNHNKLLWQLPGAEGIKTGYTRAAGRILVSSVTRCGRRVILVTIDAPDDWNDHRVLARQAFSGLEPRTLIRKGDRVGLLEVQGGERSQVPIVAAEDFSLEVRPGEEASVILPGPGFLYAPTAQGASLGEAWVLIRGTPVGRLKVSCGETVELAAEEEKSLLERIFGGNP